MRIRAGGRLWAGRSWMPDFMLAGVVSEMAGRRVHGVTRFAARLLAAEIGAQERMAGPLDSQAAGVIDRSGFPRYQSPLLSAFHVADVGESPRGSCRQPREMNRLTYSK